MARFVCSSCSYEREVSGEYVGRTIRCPQCKHTQVLGEIQQEVVLEGSEDIAPHTPVLKRMKYSERDANDASPHRAGPSNTTHSIHWSETAHIVVTTADLQVPYEVVGPIYYQISNKGLFCGQLSDMKYHYEDVLEELRNRGQTGGGRFDWLSLFVGGSVGQNDFDIAFFIAVQELKARAHMLRADAVIGMRQDIDIDTNGFQWFYLQMYGTAVRLSRAEGIKEP